MSDVLYSSRSGDFATSRRGSLSLSEIDFIRRKADAGVGAFNIARMLGCSTQDVQPWMKAYNPPSRAAPKIRTPRPQVRQVLSLWRGLITIHEPAAPPSDSPESKRALVARIAAAYDVTVDDVRGPSRVRSIARARQHVMHEMVSLGRWSLPQIGQYLGDRDHTTVLHGYRRHAQRMAELEKLGVEP